MRRVLLLILLFLAAPVVAPYDPLLTSPTQAYLPPSREHLFGTDQLGRDVLSRTLYGGQTSVALTSAATLSVIVVVAAWGVFTATNSPSESVKFRIVNITSEALRTIPSIVTTIAIITILGNTPAGLIVSTAIAQIPHTIGWLYERTEELHKLPHIEGAKGAGASPREIYITHIASFIFPEALTQAILLFQRTLLIISTLTFLGFGLRIESPEWGALLREGREGLRTAPWIAVAPGICITLLSVIALQETTKQKQVKKR